MLRTLRVGRLRSIVTVVLMVVPLAAVSPQPAAQRPPRQPQAPQGVEVVWNVPYTSVGERLLRVNIARPAQIPDEPMPVAVWIHGGGWRGGTNNPSRNYPLAQRGYFTISVEYRLTDEAIFPSQITECKAAISWLRANAEVLHINPDKIGVWGSSAGGHLAALVGTSMGVKQFEWPNAQGHSSDVQCVIDLFGPSDFAAMVGAPSRIDRTKADCPEALLLGGLISENPDKARAASPVTHVDGNEPPFLIMHGTEDQVVPFDQSEILYEALQKVGAQVTFVRVKGAGHGFSGQEIDPGREALQTMCLEFFDKHLKD